MGLLGSVLLNAVVSVACSWGVAAYYFRKETMAERIGVQLQSSLRLALMPLLFGEFFGPDASGEVTPLQPAPKNLDTPHVQYAIFAKQRLHPEDRADVLLKLLDIGSNLDNPRGVSVRDHKERKLGVWSVGFGFCRCTLNIDAGEPPGPRMLTIHLRDEAGHESTQTIPFKICERRERGE